MCVTRVDVLVWAWVCVILVMPYSVMGVSELYTPSQHARQTRQVKEAPTVPIIIDPMEKECNTCEIRMSDGSVMGVSELYTPSQHARQFGQVKDPLTVHGIIERSIVIDPPKKKCGRCKTRMSDGKCKQIVGCDDGPFIPFF
ncbi:hypothetical protein Pcinc_030352 [Petrolisthes cinctipes]|uniref:Uncharacterized protein n=1 Tax=Petrolisthes cinctipes TaxID=88211 RepID=A0AAE1K4D5_PETCI|nr:hypothetical protein Pcinc_030352 [Petrolisthes cinctipes]